jgi:hypothetical protein
MGNRASAFKTVEARDDRRRLHPVSSRTAAKRLGEII